MPLIVSAISWLISKFAVRFLSVFVYKWALKAAIVSAILVAVAVLWMGIMSLKATLVAVSLNNPFFQIGLTAVFPPNFELVLTIMAAARALDWMWRFNYQIFEKIVAVERTGMPRIGW